MKLLPAIFLILVSLVGWIFFDHYNGNLIQYTFLWKTGFVLVGLLGLWLIVKSSSSVLTRLQTSIERKEEQFKKHAQSVPIVFDQCEFHSGTYRDIQMEGGRLSGIRTFAPAQLTSSNSSPDFQMIVRSYLVFTTKYQGNSCRFVSPSFPVDLATLKYRVMQNQLLLYVDRYDSHRFLFLWVHDDGDSR